VGYWHVQGQVAGEDGTRATTATGGQYVVADQTLWTNESAERPRSLASFVQLGVADPRFSAVSRHLGAGVVATGFVPGRSDDSFGVAATMIRFGEQAEGALPSQGEVNVGAFYKFALAGWLALKPDVQFIRNPLSDAAKKTQVVSTLRFEIGF
jgi:porin